MKRTIIKIPSIVKVSFKIAYEDFFFSVESTLLAWKLLHYRGNLYAWAQ